MSDRREFLKEALKSAAAFAVVAAVPVALIKPDPGPYGQDFFNRLQTHVAKVVQREGRPIESLVVEAPGYMSARIDVMREQRPSDHRFVRLNLEGIESPFTWWEPV